MARKNKKQYQSTSVWLKIGKELRKLKIMEVQTPIGPTKDPGIWAEADGKNDNAHPISIMFSGLFDLSQDFLTFMSLRKVISSRTTSKRWVFDPTINASSDPKVRWAMVMDKIEEWKEQRNAKPKKDKASQKTQTTSS